MNTLPSFPCRAFITITIAATLLGCQSATETAQLQSPIAPAAVKAMPENTGSTNDSGQNPGVESTIPDDSPIAPQLRRAELEIDAILAVPDNQRNFSNTLGALDDLYARIDFDTGMTLFMQYVSPDPDLREAGARAEEELNSWLIDLSKREDLYRAVKTYAALQKTLKNKLTPLQQRQLKHALRDYRRAGMELSPTDREKLTTLQKEISKRSIEFEKNIREDETAVFVTLADLEGMPEDYIKGLKRAGNLYIITMDYPTFIPIGDLCTNELTRQRTWLAYKRRGGKKNVAVLEKILKLRTDAAHLLGYKTPADYETEVKMSKSGATVLDFYKKLRPLVRKKAQLDWNELLAAKREHTGDPNANFYPWDMSFYMNQLMKTKYAVDSEKIREYFPLQRVIDGLFSITQSLYGLEYKEITATASAKGFTLWHEDARLFECWDRNTNKLLGHFFIDLHPRENKYGHAAQWGLRQHKKWQDGTTELPLAALVCNFTKPTADKPSLMSHDEVQTFFHEFGHCLHTLLSDVNTYQFAGTSVERDFVEAPSQMFENWVWDADVLKTFTGHYKTGEPLPDDLLQGMIAAKNIGSGMLAEHQFYYGLIDMTYHTDEDGVVDTTQLGIDLFAEIELYDKIPGTFFQSAFGHLTGYQAGYYGYQWALVRACDMFQRFKQLGMLDPEAGAYYRKNILGKGGTLDGSDLVKNYLGRDLDMTAYLKHLGLE